MQQIAIKKIADFKEIATQKNQLSSINLLRGLAALTVCCYHLTGGFLPEGHFLRTLFGRGHLGVEVFFVISGFVIPYSMYKSGYKIQDFGKFMLKRLIRIEPPYWASMVLIIGMEVISAALLGYAVKQYDWGNIALHFTHLNGLLGKTWLNIIYWSLAIEIQYYLLMAVLFPLFFHQNWWIKGLFLLLFTLSSYYFSVYTIFGFSPYFVIGILLCQYYIGQIGEGALLILILALLGIIYHQEVIQNVVAMLFAISIILFFKRKTLIGEFLGKISYSLYLVHIPVAWSFITHFKHLTNNNLQLILLIFSGVLFSIFVAWIFYLIIEKPSQYWSQKVKF